MSSIRKAFFTAGAALGLTAALTYNSGIVLNPPVQISYDMLR